MYSARLWGKTATSTSTKGRSADVTVTPYGKRSSKTVSGKNKTSDDTVGVDTVIASGGKNAPATRKRVTTSVPDRNPGKKSKTVMVSNKTKSKQSGPSQASSPRHTNRVRKPTSKSKGYLLQSPILISFL